MHEIRLEKPAERFLKKMDTFEQKRIIEKFRKLEQNPELGKPLTGNLRGLWNLRIGKYRAIYQIKHKELLILVLDLDHRKRIYG